ncbi:MAG: Rdx family protein [Fidelibacterota bacterium]|nr:MAG: Rdx family protein [Candidatus Neomarinimicrobiota bacterium]
MAQKILERHADRISAFTLIPSGDGVFEISIDGRLRFSKKSLGRFPEDAEILKLIDSS